MFGVLKRKDKIEVGLEKSRRGWFGRLTQLFRGPRVDEATWEDVEEALISADVGVPTALSLVQRVKERAAQEGASAAPQVLEMLKEEMVRVLEVAEGTTPSWDRGGEPPHPLVVLVVGVNGVGKTTGIAKLAWHFQQSGKRVIIAAADTFRAAAIEQLRVWAERLGVDVVAHRLGGDPGAVAYDAYQAAVARDADVLIVDTAGRLHTKHNLMEELRKVHRVLNRLNEEAPHQVLLVLDATTGYNGLAQAEHFTQAVGCHGVFLAKLDGTAKGGIVLAIAQELRLPVLFIGTGEGLEDISLFDAQDFVDALFTPTQEEGVAGASL